MSDKGKNPKSVRAKPHHMSKGTDVSQIPRALKKGNQNYHGNTQVTITPDTKMNTGTDTKRNTEMDTKMNTETDTKMNTKMDTQNSTDTSTKTGHVEQSAEVLSQERMDTTETEKQSIKIQKCIMNKILNKEDINQSAKQPIPEEADNTRAPQNEVNMALEKIDDSIHMDMISFGKIYVRSTFIIAMPQKIIYVKLDANFTRPKHVIFIFGMGGLRFSLNAKAGADRIILPHLT